MTDFLAHDDENCCGGNTTYVAKSLASNENWQTSTTDCAVGNDLAANNRSLFNAQPAGYYDGNFGGLYSYSYFWTSSKSGSYANYRRLRNTERTVNSSYTDLYRGYSVRCVKD
jgi:uncharacterized protein (TIGR02145 family)